MLGFRRRRRDLRVLREEECYDRSYADRSDDVRVVRVEPRRPRFRPVVTGESLRRRFEERLEARARERDEKPQR